MGDLVRKDKFRAMTKAGNTLTRRDLLRMASVTLGCGALTSSAGGKFWIPRNDWLRTSEGQAYADTGILRSDDVRIGTASASGKTAGDYIQDGLVRHWDGELNNGYDHEHSDTIRYWKDDVSGVNAALLDGRYEWKSKAIFITAQQNAILQDKDLINSGRFTCEVCFSDNGESTNMLFFNVGSNIHMLPHRLRYQDDNGSWTEHQCTLPDAGVYSLSVGNGEIRFFINGEIQYSHDLTRTINATSDGYLYPQRMFHCIRVYDDVLSTQEIAANYAVDKERFGLS